MSRVRRLAVVLALAAACAKSTVDPCTLGYAVTDDGQTFGDFRDALQHARVTGSTLRICPGTHQLPRYAMLRESAPEGFEIVIEGDPESRPRLVPHPDKTLLDAWHGRFELRNVEIVAADTTGDDEECSYGRNLTLECESPFDAEGQPEGALSLGGVIAFNNVLISDNTGYWGGALSTTSDTYGSATVELVDSTIVRNAAVTQTRGGALLVLHTDIWEDDDGVTITSTNTDWGAGDDDNAPDDIAFASWDGYRQSSVTVHASYRFDGVADFTCSSLTYVCE